MKYVTILAAISVAIIGFVYFSLFSTPAHENAEKIEDNKADFVPPEEVVVIKPEEPQTGIASLEDLRSWGKNVECSIRYNPSGESGEVEGTYFVSDRAVRGDFLTDSPDLEGKVLSSVIVDESMIYLWSEIEGKVYGMKMNNTDASTVEKDTPVPLDEDVRYSCKPWLSVDKTIFVPPSDVLFQDLDQLMEAGMEYGTVYDDENEMPF